MCYNLLHDFTILLVLFISLHSTFSIKAKFAEFAVWLFLPLLSEMEIDTDNAVDHIGGVYLLASKINIGPCLMNEQGHVSIAC